MPKVYSQADVTEMQKGFVQELKEIHSVIHNVYSKYKSTKGLNLDLVKVLENIYDREIIIQKDINIEASNVQIKNDSN